MGAFTNIANLYKKVDQKVGGYLPGGYTPSQVKKILDEDNFVVDSPTQTTNKYTNQTNNGKHNF